METFEAMVYDPQGEVRDTLRKGYRARRRELEGGSPEKRRVGLFATLAKIENRRDNAYDLALDDTLPKDALHRKLADLEEQERVLRRELERVGDAARQLEELERAYEVAIDYFQNRWVPTDTLTETPQSGGTTTRGRG